MKNKRKPKTKNRQKSSIKIEDFNPKLSIIRLNIDCLNIPIKRQKLTEWIKKCHPKICHGSLSMVVNFCRNPLEI